MNENKIKLKYLCESFNSAIIASTLKTRGKTAVYGASGLSGYSDNEGISTEYLGIVKDGAGVGRIAQYKAGTLLVGTMSYIFPKKDCDINWLKYCIASLNLGDSIDKATIPHIYFSDYGNRSVLNLSREEQKKTANFLEGKASLVDQLISNQEKQIEKLKEYRQAIITKAVTKGLDPNVPMKNSGVKWIGSIPKFWSVARIKDLVTYNEHQLSEKSNPEQTIEYIDIGSVSLEYGIEQTQSFAFKDAPSRARRITERNDVIISTVRTYLKAIAKIEKDGLIASTGFCVLHPTKVDPNYLSYFCKSAAFCDFITANSYGISYPAIDAEQLVNAYISLPSPNEQKQIVQYIDKKCMLIDKLIDIKDRTRKQLLDFKKSLIYEYVTGKRRVSL